MKQLTILIGLAAATAASAATAHDTSIGFGSRGACEAASAAMSQEDAPWLLETFPELFDTTGEASSFLTRAWTCDRNSSDGQYYITDHIEDVLGSRWYDRRNH
jgi:hypothetical protein